ncbi:MAG: type II secretion system F family protein [Peptostreptococcaceae bacterium]|nr:type II secretion system F family protein [Peptostreptococcaceae bacterium]
MAIYDCVVYDKNNKRHKIKLEFRSEDEVEKYEKENEVKIINKKESKFKNKQKIKQKDLSDLCQQLGMLISSGCGITKSLNNIKSNCNSKIKSTLDSIDYNLKEGNSIAVSFEKTNMFNKFFINMIKAGEMSGNIDEIFYSLSNYYKKEHEFKQKLKSAMLYPVLLMAVTFFVILFMIVYVVPKFELIFSGNNINIPLTTKILIESSRFIRTYLIELILVIVIFNILLLKYIYKNEEIQLIIEKSIFKIKPIKNIVQAIEVNKFSRSFYTLIKSGIIITESLEISSHVISNKFMYKKLFISKEALEKGYSISESLEQSGVFPSVFISMISSGEETGNIDTCLYNIMVNYESNVDNLIQKIVKLIEPMIIVIMGLIIGIIVISMMTPMFDAIKVF